MQPAKVRLFSISLKQHNPQTKPNQPNPTKPIRSPSPPLVKPDRRTIWLPRMLVFTFSVYTETEVSGRWAHGWHGQMVAYMWCSRPCLSIARREVEVQPRQPGQRQELEGQQCRRDCVNSSGGHDLECKKAAVLRQVAGFANTMPFWLAPNFGSLVNCLARPGGAPKHAPVLSIWAWMCVVCCSPKTQMFPKWLLPLCRRCSLISLGQPNMCPSFWPNNLFLPFTILCNLGQCWAIR